MKKLIVIFCFLLFSAQVFGQKNWGLNVPKDSIVVLKISKSAFDFTKFSVWSGKNTYSTRIEQDKDGGLIVFGQRDWQNVDWNLMSDFFVDEVKKKKEKDFQGTEVTLKNAQINIKLLFAASVKDVAKTFDEITFKGYLNEFEKSDYYRKEVLDRFLPKIFPGKLTAMPETFKLTLLKTANYEGKWFGGENYKDKFYFVTKNTSGDYYNSVRFSQPQRVSYVFNQMLLNYLKFVHGELKTIKEIEGVKIDYEILHKNFVTGLDVGADNLQVYATMENIKLFSEFEITGQELLDRSLVVIDGNRANVNLTLQ